MVAIYRDLCAWDNLLLAFRRASKGKRGQPNVAAFEHRLEDHLLDLRAKLRAHTYQPGPYNSFYIHEPKRRLISAAPSATGWFITRSVTSLSPSSNAHLSPIRTPTVSVKARIAP